MDIKILDGTETGSVFVYMFRDASNRTVITFQVCALATLDILEENSEWFPAIVDKKQIILKGCQEIFSCVCGDQNIIVSSPRTKEFLSINQSISTDKHRQLTLKKHKDVIYCGFSEMHFANIYSDDCVTEAGNKILYRNLSSLLESHGKQCSYNDELITIITHS